MAEDQQPKSREHEPDETGAREDGKKAAIEQAQQEAAEAREAEGGYQ